MGGALYQPLGARCVSTGAWGHTHRSGFSLATNKVAWPTRFANQIHPHISPLVSSCTLFPTICWAMNVCELTLAVLTSPRSRTCTAGWGAWRIPWWVRECLGRRLSVNFGCWIVVFIWCNYLSILYRTSLYINDVTFVYVPWFIICVRLDKSRLEGGE
jgi:hypothetical protein